MLRRRDLASRLPGVPTFQSGLYFRQAAGQVEHLAPNMARGIYLGPSSAVHDQFEAEDVVIPGTDPTDSLPLSVDMFGGRPRQMVVVSETDVGRLMALRAAACGAFVIVVTMHPTWWSSMFAGERPEQFHVAGSGERLPEVPAAQPLLVVVDRVSPQWISMDLPQNQRGEVWLADTAALAEYEGLLEDADIVGYGRTRPDVVNQALELGRTSPRLAMLIENLEHNQLVLRTRNAERVVELHTTVAEDKLLRSAFPGAADQPR